MSTAAIQTQVSSHPVHLLRDPYRDRTYIGTLALFVTFEGKEESVLATCNPAEFASAHHNGMQKAYDHLVQEQQRWTHNGEPKYVSAKYRIDAYRRL